MAKKIRFPLKLAEGAEVRTLEELREHFDLEAVLGYYKSGKLLTWLEDRYLEGEAEAVCALDEAAPDFQKRLCEVFQVEYTGSDVDLEEIGRRQERLKRLRLVTDEQEYIDHIDQVAFDQEDLADLLDEEQAMIYLCGEKFTVPASRKGVAYVGIHEPAVHISGALPEDPEELGIVFRGCAVDNLPVAKLMYATMDKCYAIGLGDPIPAGVKETDRVESFLIRTYETLGLSADAEIELELSPKIDGVSVNGTILKDTLLNPQTRGDEDKSVKVIGMHGMMVGDEDVESRQEFGIQYELFITDADREAADKYLNYQYVSNRHCASGLTHRLCTMEDDKLLEMINLFPIEAEGLDGTYRVRMDYLQKFAVGPQTIRRVIIKDNLKGLLKKIRKEFAEYTQMREKLTYSIDGMVITVVDDDYQEQLGRKGRTNLYQIALKFDPAVAVGEVKGIHLDRGKKGYRTIQVDLKHPVFLDGVRYDHVPVLSAGLFEEMGLREGSEVEVRRVGDVIPSISVTKMGTGGTLKLPEVCDVCGGSLEIKNKKLYCPNPGCRGNLVGKITGFLEGIGLEGYSDGFAEFLLEEFGPKSKDVQVRSLADLYKLTDDVLDAHELDRKDIRTFRDKLIHATGKVPDYVVFGSMGWPDIGVARAKLIFRAFKMYNKDKPAGPILEYVYDCPPWIALTRLVCDNRDLVWHYNGMRSPGCTSEAIELAIGRTMWNKLYRSVEYTSSENRKLLEEELEAMEKYATNITENFDSVLKVGHTGYTPSAEVRAACEKNQFELVDGKSFDILITGDLKSTSGKMEKANKANLPIYTEETFLKKYN